MTRPDKDDPPRLALIAHLREQIERDPEAYANIRKLEASLRRMVAEEAARPRSAAEWFDQQSFNGRA